MPAIVPETWGRRETMQSPVGDITFLSAKSGWRFRTMFDKEPETIDWISAFEPNTLLIDIGANVGIFSVYAAILGHRVIAIEPSPANYFQLCGNILLNDLSDSVVPLSNPLSDYTCFLPINFQSLDFGASMASIKEPLDFRNKQFNPSGQISQLALTIDDILVHYIKDRKNFKKIAIKIDVDGHEFTILKGSFKCLSDGAIDTILVELPENEEQFVMEVNLFLKNLTLS